MLGLFDAGTKKHLVTIFQKLGAADRTEAVVIAIQSGLIKVAWLGVSGGPTK